MDQFLEQFYDILYENEENIFEWMENEVKMIKRKRMFGKKEKRKRKRILTESISNWRRKIKTLSYASSPRDYHLCTRSNLHLSAVASAEINTWRSPPCPNHTSSTLLYFFLWKIFIITHQIKYLWKSSKLNEYERKRIQFNA